jgi:membrane-associated phospholipid phosphatase
MITRQFLIRINKIWRSIALAIFIIYLSIDVYGQDSLITYKCVPITKVFYKLGNNVVGSFKYHYGLNYIIAGAITYGMVESNIDWNWYRFSYKNKWIYNTGYISVYTGGIVPTAVSLGLYLYGRADKNSDIQITGLALGQAALLGLAISSGIKVVTGRVPPTKLNFTDDLRGDFRFGFLKGGANNGWPSSHTCVAFSMATALIELYPNNTAIKICSLTYASLIGLGVSTNIHWASDAVAGALIGWAIGRTIGISFRNLMNETQKSQACNFYVAPTGVRFNYRF